MLELSQSHKMWPVPARYQETIPAEWAAEGRKLYPQGWEDAKTWLAGFPRYLSLSESVQERGHGLVLVGPPGVGKTMLASAFQNYLRRKGFSTAFVRDSDLNTLLIKRYPSDEEEARLWLLQRAACVVVDDALRMGGEPKTLEPFLRGRMDEAKPTIVTMNDTVTMGEAFTSLVHEFTYITFKGDDLRQKSDW